MAIPAKLEDDASYPLARFAAELAYEQLPPEVVSATKLIILDSLGTRLSVPVMPHTP